MIQRVQTIWMILAAIAVFLTIKFAFYSGVVNGVLALPAGPDTINASMGGYHLVRATDNFLILILTSALGTGIIINIFLFKHRSIQIRIILLAILMECLIIFLIMASRGIYRDSKLVKESNRLR
jgi:hypothetical protein